MREILVPHSLLLEVKPALESVWEDLDGIESLILWVSGKKDLVCALVSPMYIWEKAMKQRDHWLLIRVKLFFA
jgi:hypothetical protein